MGWAVDGIERTDRLLAFMFDPRSSEQRLSEQVIIGATLGAVLSNWQRCDARMLIELAEIDSGAP